MQTKELRTINKVILRRLEVNRLKHVGGITKESANLDRTVDMNTSVCTVERQGI